MNSIVIGIVILAAIVISGSVILYDRKKMRMVMQNLNDMLDLAIEGRFLESHYDESMLSSVESKLAHYLSSSEVSANNLKQEKEKIKELIGDISHQTKTPIASILLYAQLLKEKNLPKDALECVEPLNAQAEKMSFLIDALVKTSRLENGILVLHPRKACVWEMIEDVLLQAKMQAEEKNIKLLCVKAGEGTEAEKLKDREEGTEAKKHKDREEETEDKSCDIQACFDPKWTKEALYNVVDNAIKYSFENTSVEIAITAYELFVRVDVTDHGIGILEEEQAKIFQRFYRGEEVREEKGVGIGLFLAREILSHEGGYIKVSSVTGQGTVFSLFLPTDKS